MLSDEEIISLMVSEPSWEDVIIKIVADEGMDPWDIDISRLAERFIEFLNKSEQLDLRIPARFVLIAAILLRMKSDVFCPKKERVLIPESPDSKEDSDILRKLAEAPELVPPVKRLPVRGVSLDELVTALKKAFEVRERRIRRKVRRNVKVEDFVEPEEDITERISKLTKRITEIIEELGSESVEFSKLVNEWRREEIVRTLIPLLHLSQEGSVSLEQKELFREIFVRLKRS
ncbi:MAG: segregation/condensation protein A [Candidatus Micrarchaeota archaeon]|nr:segregation/condensation protein A [Candidatus Micrarchaeota archaeon]